MKGFAGLAPINLIPISFFFFFFGKSVGFCFQYIGHFFLVGLPVTIFFFFFFFQILVQNFFGLFFYLIVFLILTRVFLFFLKGKQIKKINYYI